MTGWLPGQAGLWLPLASPPSLPEPAREEDHMSECMCLLSVWAAGSLPDPASAAALCCSVLGVQAAVVLLPTLVALRCSTLCPATSSRLAGSSRFCVCQGRIFPTLRKHYLISCGGFSHLRPLLPPLQACWHSLISIPGISPQPVTTSGGSNFTVL